STLGQWRLAGPLFRQQLYLQPHWPLRRIESRLRERGFPRWSGAALPEPQFRLHGRRRQPGPSIVGRSERTLGKKPPVRRSKPRPAGLQNPSATSIAEMHRFIAKYDDGRLKANADAIMNSLDFLRQECSVEELARPEFITDDFAAAGIDSKQDICKLFSDNFYFGCEADDRTTLWAFDSRMGFRPRPVFSSDLTHFEVPDFAEVILEAFEMMEKGFVTEQDFRELTFTNAARLHTRNNPNFFKGTVVEQAVADELGLETASPAANA